MTWYSAAVFILIATGALANGLGESGTWTFQSSADKANKAAVASQIEQAQAGYGPSTTTITYNVDGNLVNCNLNSTAVGNTGTNAQDAPVGSPNVTLGSSVQAGSTGNTSTNSAQGGAADAGNSNGGMVDSALGMGETITQTPETSTSLVSDQANAGTQQSSVGTVNNEYALAGISGTGGGGQANLNSTQTMTGTTLTSQVQGSNACDFQTTSGNLASPINAVSSESFE